MINSILIMVKMKAVPAEGVASARLGEAVSISCSVQVFLIMIAIMKVIMVMTIMMILV